MDKLSEGEVVLKIFAGEINMNIVGIIKDSFLFPSKNTGRFAIYLLLSVFVSLFAFGGILTYAWGLIDAENYLTGGIYLIISLLILVILAGYHIKVIKSGIELDEEVPVFELYDDFMTGFDSLIVAIAYFIIPVIIVLLIGYDTNVFGNAVAVGREFVSQVFNVYIMGNSGDVTAISHHLANLGGSLAITLAAASVLFVVFTIIESVGQARLANTGSLKEALNIIESLKDLVKIGIGRSILLIFLVIVIIAIIEMISLFIFNSFPFLVSTFYIVITPYLVLVTQRALGLLYSDIA